MIKTDDIQYHIKCRRGDIGRWCILPGDPARCEKIAAYLDSPSHFSTNREYTVWNGYLSGEKVTVCSTGIGGPSAAIAMEELASCGADTFIRIGTCGGIALKVKANDIIIASGAVRAEGTSREYAPIEFPAVPDFSVLSALKIASDKSGFNSHIGVVQCKDSFYGQHSPDRMPVSYELRNKWEAWKRLGVLASEMESAALFTVASALSVRCGSVFSVVWNQERALSGLDDKDCENHNTENAIKVAIEAMKLLIYDSNQ